MHPIFLLGYMGSGKTTVGRAVAKATGLEFIDLDHYIESRFCKSIKDIFAEKGEEGFREVERAMLSEVCNFENVIVACGGGTPCFYDNMEVMSRAGSTVYLNASVDVLHSRLLSGRAARPLIANLDDEGLRTFIADALAKREPHYLKATVNFPANLLESGEQIKETVSRLIDTLALQVQE